MKNQLVVTLILTTLLLPRLVAEPCADGCGSHGSETKPKTIDELFKVQCEHKIPQSACDECRYELGLVKLDPSLIRTAEKTNGLIVVETVQKQSAQTLLTLNGEIALNETALAHVSPRVAGAVKTIKADLGQQVKKGDVLFEIESPELGLAIGTCRKNRALAALALKNVEREKTLVAKKLSPEVDLIEAQMKYDEYRIEVESAENALRVMGLDEATLEALTSDRASGKQFTLPVTAPQDGIVIQKHLDQGEATASGKDVLTIADLSSVWVWLNVYEQDLARLLGEAKKGMPRVRITTRAFPDKVFEGEINLVGSLVDEHDRTVKVRAVLKNSDALLRPGMFCMGNVVYDMPEKVVAVPKVALMSDEGNFFVFRQVRDQFVLRTAVKTGRIFSDSVEIIGGLSEGDKIVTEGAFVCKSDVLREKMGAGCAD